MTAMVCPWGRLDWVLGRLSARRWTLIGAVSFEERSLAAWRALKGTSRHSLNSSRLLHIVEPFGNDVPETRLAKRRTNRRKSQFISEGGDISAISEHALMASDAAIVSTAKSLLASRPDSVVLDISSLPKRYFFPMLVELLDSSLQDLIVTYTIPKKYGAPLAREADGWAALPMFGPNPTSGTTQPILIIGVGYEHLFIQDILEGRHYSAQDVRFLLPFPSKPPGIEKNWRFLLHIEQQLTRLEQAFIRRVHPLDVPTAFNEIVAQTNAGTSPTVLAPFGPKPFSLAMALFGYNKRLRNEDVEIGYTQPKIYNPDYSSGVDSEAGHDRIMAYCIRLQGRNYYTL